MNLSHDIKKGVSILIPSYKNLPYLRVCVEGILKYSLYPHQILVFLQGYSDEEKNFLKGKGIEFLYHDSNVGVPRAVNRLFELSCKQTIMYANDDMFFLPGWDYYLASFVEGKKLSDLSWLSSTMIEPEGNNPCVLVSNYGKNLNEFNREGLLSDLEELILEKPDVKGTTWPPNLMHRKYFQEIGGFSEEYGVGIGSDPDLAKKMYDIGCRDFVGVGKSLVYHFGSKTTRRVKRNNGKKIFFDKHGMTIDCFVNDFLKRGEKYE